MTTIYLISVVLSLIVVVFATEDKLFKPCDDLMLVSIIPFINTWFVILYVIAYFRSKE